MDARARVDLPDEEVLEFFGTAGTLSARVRLRNDGDDRVRLRRATARSMTAAAAAGPVPLAAYVARRTVLDAHAAAEVPLRLRIDRTTPPGDHDAEVVVGGRVRRAVLHVQETVAVTVAPSEVVLANAPGEQERSVVVTNDGNVPFVVASTAVPMDDERLECRSLRAAARRFAAREDDPGFGEFLAETVRQADRALERAGVLRLRAVGGEVVVHPGQQVAVRCAFELPSTLDRHTRYTALVPFGPVDLLVVAVPTVLRRDPDTKDPDTTTDVGSGSDPTPAPKRTAPKRTARTTAPSKAAPSKAATTRTTSPSARRKP